MTNEETIQHTHKVVEKVRYLIKLCSALNLEELEIAIARTADLLTQQSDELTRSHLETLGILLVHYRKARIAGIAPRRILKRVSLWQSAGDSKSLDYSIEVMHSLQIDAAMLSLIDQDKLGHIIRLNGR
ncbi:MAG: hypothetical protein H2172_11680 [Opitutus sp.]|nr:hypothetical protein [Opitutus sp.]MCS6277008.1 hypothetical protein [Opitutus sp.]MCS6299944.1 hypothetical protein [Opitutus sp.]